MFKNRTKLFLLLTLIFITLWGLSTISAADAENNLTGDIEGSDMSLNNLESDISTLQKDTLSDNKQVYNDIKIEKNKVNNNLKTDTSDDIVYVDVSGNYSSNGTDSNNPTTINNAFGNVKENGTIVLLGNSQTTTYNINQNITTSTITIGVNNFKIKADENSNIILCFNSYNGMRLSGNYNIEISNISFTRTAESNCPVIYNNINLTLNDCSFYNINNSELYGAIYNYKTLTLNNCEFYNNYATRQGSVIFTNSSNVNIYNSKFYNNTAAENGAIISSVNSRITIQNSTFTSNYASFGGVYSIRDNSRLNVNKSTFINNSARYNGGVVDSWYSSSLFNNSIFINNSADYGGLVFSANNVETKILNSLMDANVAYLTANNIYSYRDNLTVDNNVIIDSNNDTKSIYCYNVSYKLDNNWWGTNNPNFDVITNNLLPNNWRLMTVDLAGNNCINVSLNQLTGHKTINKDLFNRTVYFRSQGNVETGSISSSLLKEVNFNPNDIIVEIDNQVMKLSDKIIPYFSISDIDAKINDNVTITVKCNPDITDAITLKINDMTFANVVPVKGLAKYNYSFNSSWNTGTYTLTASIINNEIYNDTIITSTLNLKDNFNTSVVLITNKNPNNYVYENDSSNRNLDKAKEFQTSVKDQASSGSCWAFSALAALESAYKTAYGIEYDFSENNMKNILKKYSTIGDIGDYPNGGNTELEPIAYLVGWYGPVNETDDAYDDYSIMSPFLNNALKVEDVYFFYRKNATGGTDNKMLKDAIRKYGALSTSIFASYSGTSGNSLYTTTQYPDHAVTLVGWNDFYDSFSSYNKPAGIGAYIIKNSWGEDIGIDGYQYVSYYDKSFAGVSKGNLVSSFSYAFPVKTYENYTNIYQHDTVAENIQTLTPEAWMRNVYTATKNESIAGVGTFIYEDTAYEAYIYVNDRLYYTQKGNITQEGYRIIKLDQYVPVKEGDVFKVDLKLKAFDGEYTIVTLQDTTHYKSISKENQSFISTDGENWEDLFTSYDNKYSAACLKVYTKETPSMNSIVNDTENYQITTKIEDLDSNGRLSYKIDDEYWTDADDNIVYQYVTQNGTYTITIPSRDVEKYEYNITVILESEGYTVTENVTIITPVNIKITTQNYTFLIDEDKTVYATVEIEDNVYNNQINDGMIVLLDNNRIIDKCDVIDGRVSFNLNLSAGNHSYTLSYRGSPVYICSNVQLNVTVLKHNVTIEITKIENNTVYDITRVTGRIYSDNNQPMSNAFVYVTINGISQYVKADSRGIFTVTQFMNSTNPCPIKITFNSNSTHNGGLLEDIITVNKQNSKLTIDKIKTVCIYDHVNIIGRLLNQFNNYINGTITLTINGQEHNVTVSEGIFRFEYVADIIGTNNITAKYNGTEIYFGSENESTFKVKKIGIIINIPQLENIKLNDMIGLYGLLTNEHGEIIGNTQVNVILNGNDEVVPVNEEGIFEYIFQSNRIGTNEIVVHFDGDDIHFAGFIEQNFEVEGLTTTITIADIPELRYSDEYNITGILTDVNGQRLNKTTVTLNINGKEYSLQTNANGVYTYNYKITSVGTNNVTVTFAGNEIYSNSIANTTFNVLKADCIITYESIPDIKFNDMLTITGTFTDIKGKPLTKSTVTILINGVQTQVKTNSEGIYTLTTKANTVGTNNITLKYLGSNNYNQFITNTTFNVEKQDLVLTLNNIQDTNYSKTYTIKGTFKDANNKAITKSNVKIIINGKTSYAKTDDNGVYTFVVKANVVGVNNVTVGYGGSNGYNPAQNISTSFRVSKQDLVVTVNEIENTVYGNNVTITGTFKDIDSKPLTKSNVKILLNGAKYYARTDDNGVYTLVVKANVVGVNNVTLGYDGTSGYNPAQNIFTTFNVSKQDCIVTFSDIGQGICNENINITGTFKDKNGLILTNSKIKIILNNNVFYTKTDANGNYIFTTKLTTAGINNLTVGYGGNAKYNAYYANTSFNVVKQDVIVTYNPIENTKLNKNFTITGTFKDANGKKLSNSKVKITINSKVNYVTTDANGNYVFTAKATKLGVNNVTVGYAGSDKYNEYSAQTTFLVEN